MRLVYAKQGIEIVMEENRVSTLLIENPTILCEMLQSLLGQMEGGEGGVDTFRGGYGSAFGKKQCVY